MRPSIAAYLMEVARVVAKRSDWPGTQVGCVAAVDGMIRSTGYNGTPKGWRVNHAELLDIKEQMTQVLCHAEENAIVQAARAGTSLNGATFYTTMSPCLSCAAMMINVGAREVIYGTKWERAEADDAVRLLIECGVRINTLEASI